MVFSYYLYKYPYKLIWYFFKQLKTNPEVVIYCADPLDYVVLEPVLIHLPELPIVVKNKKTARYLQNRRIPFKRMPCFPDGVIMCRHATHKFPKEKIIKIGFLHGTFHFKAFANVRYFNTFYLYFMTSEKKVEEVKTKGIKTARAIGFPKLDPVFNGLIDEELIKTIFYETKLDFNKKNSYFYCYLG